MNRRHRGARFPVGGKCMLMQRFLVFCIILGCCFFSARSVSAGINEWTSTGPEGGDISAIVIDPTTPSTIYAGTSGGVFKSINGGGSWNAVNTSLTSTYVYSLAVNPITPSTIYAGPLEGCLRA